MDHNLLDPRNEVSLMLQSNAGNDEERRAYCKFVHDFRIRALQLRSQPNGGLSGPPKEDAK
jgi:hypothetical protein